MKNFDFSTSNNPSNTSILQQAILLIALRRLVQKKATVEA